MVTINQKSPVSASAEARVDAGIQCVWDVLTDINRWPEWNPDVKSASLKGNLAAGTVFTWKAGPGKIVSTIRQVEPPKVIVWTGSTMGIQAVHVWRLEPDAGRTIVRTEESWDGLLVSLARWPMRRMLRSAVTSGLKHLKTEAERKAQSTDL